MQTLPTPTDCCSPCSTTTTVNLPGPKGDAGSNGTNGANGTNAFTDVVTEFDMPTYAASVNVNVGNNAWASVGQIVYVESAGYMEVTAKPDAATLTLKNLADGVAAYPDNAAPGTTIAVASLISPGGLQGPDGDLSGTLSGQVTGTPGATVLSVTTTKGDIIVDSGANSPNAAAVRMAIGADGTRLMADAASANGMKYDKVDLSSSSQVKNAAAVANGGTGATTAAGARTNLGLGDMAVQNASAVAITGGSVAGITDLAVSDGGTGASTAAGARTNLNVLSGYGILGSITALNLNSTTTDNAVTIGSARYLIDKIILENPSAAVTAATLGLFTAAGGGGTTLCANQALSGTLTGTTKIMALAKQAIVDTDERTDGTLYLRVGTAEGAARTVNAVIVGWKFD